MLFLAVVGGVVLALSPPTTHTASAATTCSTVYSALPSSITTKVSANLGFYQAASNATGVPWELLAAIHYRETNFSHANPNNGQGIFQFVNGDGGPYPPGPVSDGNFQQQLNYMAGRIQSDYVYRGTLGYTHRPLVQNEIDDFRVQDTLYSYNGRSSQYSQQGIQYGFNAGSQPYEGSPYVMNMFDCARSNMGIITRDYGNIDGVDTRYGAYTLYTRLKNDSYWQSRYDFLGTNTKLSLPGCPQATNTSLACIWRLEQFGTGAPAMASSIEERDLLITYGYKLNGTEFHANVPIGAQPGNIPIYEVQGSDGLDFFTADLSEKTALVNSYGYTDKGIGFYANQAEANSGYPVYRMYSASLGRHIWAASLGLKQKLLASGYADEGVAFSSISSTRQETPPIAGQHLVYRFTGMPGNSHFWTTDINERDNMINAGYAYEGVAWHSSTPATSTPVYRLYAPSIQQHVWTTDSNEKNILSSSGMWNYEGISQYTSSTSTATPVYRLYSPITKAHLWTSDANERDTLIRNGSFRYEGTAWYAL